MTTTPREVHTQIHVHCIQFTYKNKLVLVVCHVPQDTAYRPHITFTVITAAERDMTLHTQSELMENFSIPSSRRGSCSRRVSLTEIAKEEFRSHIRWCTYSIVDYFVSYKRGIDFAMNPPQKVSAYEDLFNTLATPKSAARETSSELHLHHFYFANSPSLIFRLLSSNTFSGFMSLWMIFFK